MESCVLKIIHATGMKYNDPMRVPHQFRIGMIYRMFHIRWSTEEMT
jgi:hypothetical protein